MAKNNHAAANIKKLREKNNLSQDDFAKKLSVSRPTISQWENGKMLPTAEQLISISEIFDESIDGILSINVIAQRWVIPDTSALINRPRIIDALVEKYDRVIIPEIVISELNFLKEKNGKKRVKKAAWLVLASISNHSKSPSKKLDIEVCNSKKDRNDDRIIDFAVHLADSHSKAKITVLSNDVYFSVQKKLSSNLLFLSLSEYDNSINLDKKIDIPATQEFFNSIRLKKVDIAKKYATRADINREDSATGFTPLIQAIRNKDLKSVEYLVSLPGIDMNKVDDSKYAIPPISHAIQMNNDDIFSLLIESGCDIDKGSKGKNSGNTPLMIAAWHGRVKFAKELIENGACLNQQDTNGFTPLIKACKRKHLEMVRELLDGTDLKIRDRTGKTAKEHAHGNMKIMDLLKQLPMDAEKDD